MLDIISFLIFFMCIVCLCKYMPCVYRCPQRPIDGIIFPGTGDSSELSDVVAGN